MRLLLDHRDTEPEAELACYRASLAWAAARGDRFVMTLEPEVYDSPSQMADLAALGRLTGVESEHRPGILGRLLGRGAASEGLVHVEGAPDERLVERLTGMPVPEKVISGDLCAARDVRILRGDRALYSVLEYGRDQVFELEGDEREELDRSLQGASAGPIRLVPAP